MSGRQTRNDLMDAACRVAAAGGLRAVSARAVATDANVNQALVFYHFNTVDGLIREAFDRATRALIAEYETRLASVDSFERLHAVGVELADRARTDGSAAILAHSISAAYTDPEHARALAGCLDQWHEVIAGTVQRLLSDKQLHDEVDVVVLTEALAASTIGMITLDVLHAPSAPATLRAVGGLAVLLDRVLRFAPAPLARRMLRSLG